MRGWGSKDDLDWESLGSAYGTIQIPAGKELSLGVMGDAVQNLAALKTLGPDAFQDLNLNGTPIKDDQLVQLQSFPGIHSLFLGMTSITGEGLASLKGFDALELLDLYLCEQLTDASLTHLKNFPALRELNLHQTLISDAGLANLKEVKSLQKLWLCYTKVTNDGLANLTALPSLRALDLPFRITDEGVTHLGEIKTLEEVYFYMNGLVKERGLAALAKLPALKILYLGCDQVNDVSIMELKGCPSLRLLYLLNTKVTEAGIGQLKQSLPNCKIYR